MGRLGSWALLGHLQGCSSEGEEEEEQGAPWPGPVGQGAAGPRAVHVARGQ